MTFEEAKKIKLLKDNSIINEDNIKEFLFIVPKLEEDLHKWLRNFDVLTTTDEDAKKYCSNSEYALRYQGNAHLSIR